MKNPEGMSGEFSENPEVDPDGLTPEQRKQANDREGMLFTEQPMNNLEFNSVHDFIALYSDLIIDLKELSSLDQSDENARLEVQKWIDIEMKRMVPIEPVETIKRSEIERERTDFLRIIETFELNFSLEKLNEITELTIVEAQTHPFREPARKALIPITYRRNRFKLFLEQSKISEEEFNELDANYAKISRAVGWHHHINKIRHE